jgi:hypothetical protein
VHEGCTRLPQGRAQFSMVHMGMVVIKDGHGGKDVIYKHDR